MKALVTGSAGFIGRNLVLGLAQCGHEVVGLDRNPPSLRAGRSLVMDLADRRNLGELARWTAWADVVFHLAARPGVRASGPNTELARHRDILVATDHLLEASPPDTHLVVASSSAVYGGALRVNGSLRASREDDALLPRGSYAEYKRRMEVLASTRRSLHKGLAIVRPFTVIGEHQRQDMALSLWIRAVDRGDPVLILGGPQRVRDVTDVRRVVEGLIRVGELRYCGVVNLGAGMPRSLGEMVEVVFSVMGRDTDVLIEPAGPEEVEATYADVTRASSELGVDMSTDLEDALRRQVAARASLQRVPELIGVNP